VLSSVEEAAEEFGNVDFSAVPMPNEDPMRAGWSASSGVVESDEQVASRVSAPAERAQRRRGPGLCESTAYDAQARGGRGCTRNTVHGRGRYCAGAYHASLGEQSTLHTLCHTDSAYGWMCSSHSACTRSWSGWRISPRKRSLCPRAARTDIDSAQTHTAPPAPHHLLRTPSRALAEPRLGASATHRARLLHAHRQPALFAGLRSADALGVALPRVQLRPQV
jgi:hypothetical protein